MTTYKPTTRCPDCGRAPNVRFTKREVERARKERIRARVQSVHCQNSRCRGRYWIRAGEIANATSEMGGSPETAPSGELPEDFPGRAALVKAGLTTVRSVADVADLTEIPGIGPATAELIHEALDMHENGAQVAA